MLSIYKPKSIQVIGFDRYNYDFLKKTNGKVLEEYTWHPTEERILIKDAPRSY